MSSSAWGGGGGIDDEVVVDSVVAFSSSSAPGGLDSSTVLSPSFCRLEAREVFSASDIVDI